MMIIFFKNLINRHGFYAIFFLPFFVFNVCDARVISPPELNAQRVIVKDKKAHLTIKNKSDKAWLIQSWIEGLDKKKQKKMILPEFARVEAHSSLNLTIYPKEFKENNKEDMYWLTVRMIPELDEQENINFAIPVNYKLKVFQRPDALSVSGRKLSDLEWKTYNGILFIKNRSGFHYSFSELLFSHYKIVPPAKDVLLPFGEVQFKIPDKAGCFLSYSFTDDFGDDKKIIIKRKSA
ncbi:fimbrial biogenesis chaperone [Raoultella planticola]|uniref:fimbrial biogenesis chaperone n=1 Tax=Raoultella planticola TaxID=575 RepID=UPI0038509AB6